MRFLLDECLSPRLAALLAAAGHDVLHVSEVGLCGHLDEEVLTAAREEDRVLVSADTDFGELIAGQRAHLPSLILFRQGNRRPEHQAHTLQAALPDISDDLGSGAIIVFTNQNIRIRTLPIAR